MRKEQAVASRLPLELLKDLEMIEAQEQADRSTVVRKLLKKAVGDWKREHYAQLYGEGKISLARAAREASVSLWEMMDYVRQRKITAQYDLEELRKDIQGILKGRG
jgi:predicted HTH domain antitoxin